MKFLHSFIFSLSAWIVFFGSAERATERTASAQVHFNADERRIIAITDERRDADSLLPYLTSSDVKVARRAAIGIGNIGDTSVRMELLQALLHETRDTVADAEAFALGLFGPDGNVYHALVENANAHPTRERLKAIARTAPKSDSALAPEIVHRLAAEHKIDPSAEADAYLTFALRHETNSDMWNDVGTLAEANNPEVRWRAAYAFARADDSADLSARFSTLSDLLLDQGTADARMFGALALGKLHDERASTELARAYRGEDDWRVRVNMLRAYQSFSRFDSLTLETLEFAIESATADSATWIEVGLAAGDAVEHIVASGNLHSDDSAALRDWLDGFSGENSSHPYVATIVAAHLVLPAVEIHTPSRFDALQYYFGSHDPTIRDEGLRAIASMADTMYFKLVLLTLARLTPIEQAASLDALDSLWKHSKTFPTIRKSLEKSRLVDLYRGLLIHVSDAVQDDAVDVPALNHLMDTSIITNAAQRGEAMALIEKYIPMFLVPRLRDALLADVEAEEWLGNGSHVADSELRIAYDTANAWNDNELMDTIGRAVHAIEGASASLPARLRRVSHIDWNDIESLPANLNINFSDGTIQIHLLTDETPLTVWNMARLAREQWFAGNMVHRVVPNFVIQSGDPTGTGWGGPGYTIRSEITPREYNRAGTCGMASDGKDTEGSQWFITQCPTPHLDTHYTIWGEVIGDKTAIFQRTVGNIISSVLLATP